MLQTDRGTLDCCDTDLLCSLCTNATRLSSLILPRLNRTPTDPDIYSNRKIKIPDISSSHPEKLLSDDNRLKRTRTGSLNEHMLRIPQVEITTADYTSIDGVIVNNIDNTLLTVRQCIDPYTPESAESHSPNIGASSISDLSNEIIDVLTSDTDVISNKINRDRSVSPTQLKNRLDKLLNDKSMPELQRLNSESCVSDSSKGNSCFALKCYNFCRRKARKFKCNCNFTKCFTS